MQENFASTKPANSKSGAAPLLELQRLPPFCCLAMGADQASSDFPQFKTQDRKTMGFAGSSSDTKRISTPPTALQDAARSCRGSHNAMVVLQLQTEDLARPGGAVAETQDRKIGEIKKPLRLAYDYRPVPPSTL